MIQVKVWATGLEQRGTCLVANTLTALGITRDITERHNTPSGVAAFMSAPIKTPFITPSMDFRSENGVVWWCTGQQVEFTMGKRVGETAQPLGRPLREVVQIILARMLGHVRHLPCRVLEFGRVAKASHEPFETVPAPP